MKVLLLVLVLVVGLLTILEVSLRLIVGFGNPIAINEYSMRSAAIALKRPASTLRVLLLGDSIANGAWWTDQDKTIPALIATQLKHLIGKAASESLSTQPFFERVE